MNAAPLHSAAELLDLPAALQLIAQHADTSAGKRAVLDLRPLPIVEQVRDMQDEVADARLLEESATPIPLRGLRDIVEAAENAARGVVLEPAVLLDVAASLQCAERTRRFFAERRERVPSLARYAELLMSNADLVRYITQAIDSDATVKDTASAELERLRLLQRTLENRIQGKLQSVLRSPQHARMLQDPYITQRGDRYVLPVRQEYRSEFPGLVLDTSSSGATVFMEPWDVVEPGNDLREATRAEAHEVDRILRALAQRVGEQAQVLRDNQEVMTLLDVRSAVARHAGATRSIRVDVAAEPVLKLRGARHPLLGQRAVPVDIELTAERRLVVITGPNTGGKTVALKTLGLLTLMGMCGLPLPVGEASALGFFDEVLADIGDEQSLAQNLSTFSGHMRQVQRILEDAGPHTLVLLDEVGAGTDPREGTSLSVAILEHLHEAGCFIALTTHHSELKTFAASYPGAINAAVEFDPATLQPTYRILMGQPGRSCALEIAGRLGLPGSVLDRARELLGATHISLDSLVAELMSERQQLEIQVTDARRWQAEAEAARGAAEEEARQARADRERVVAQAQRDVTDLMEAVRDEVQGLLKEIRAQAVAMHDSEQLSTVDRLDHRARTAIGALGEVARDCLQSLSPPAPQASTNTPAAAPAEPCTWKEGDKVILRRLGQEGKVEKVRGSEVVVRLGALTMTVPSSEVTAATGSARKQLEASKREGGATSGRPSRAPADERPEPVGRGARPPSAEGRQPAAVTASIERVASLQTRLSLLGRRAEQASYELERYLDGLAGSNVGQVTVVHGKGTGVLQKVVHEVLAMHPTVLEHRFGEPSEGGWGVTVVTLR